MRRFTRSDADMEKLREMYASWGHPECTPHREELPLIGFIEDGKAAMFLYSTDSRICSFEHAVTVRGAEGHTEAIHALVERLMVEAKRLHFTKVFIYVGSEHAKKRALATGFTLDAEPQRWQLSREVK